MKEHKFSKSDVIYRLEQCLNRTLGEIDNKGIFADVKRFKLQKGIAGTIIEQSVFGYEPDSEQKPDLVIIDVGVPVKTELKTTGLVVNLKPKKHFEAKEPMSITAVGIYDISGQTFETSHFLAKIENLLLVYYHYLSSSAVDVSEYKDFPIVGYEFHKFTNEEMAILKKDWENVHALCKEVLSWHPVINDKSWKEAVKQDYIKVHGRLRSILTFVNLAPTFPPRFRLKKPVVSAIVANHFGYSLEQLPGRYLSMLDVDAKCNEITRKFKGFKISELAELLGVPYEPNKENKAISERIVVALFGGSSSKLNQVELFAKFGLIAKTVTITNKGGRTEDMKLYHIDFNEMVKTQIEDEELGERDFVFEDSEMYSYFSDHEFLCILFREPEPVYQIGKDGAKKNINKKGDNVFVGFKRLVFDDGFLDKHVRPVWLDTRDKIINDKLVDVVSKTKDGKVIYNKSGDISSAPNFMKSSESVVFFRGSGKDSSLINKTECVNGIKMLPQYLWIKGSVIVNLLGVRSDVHSVNDGSNSASVAFKEGEDLSSLGFVAEDGGKV